MPEAPDAVEIRVAACLVEKQRTTPDVYPLSLNSLRIACNQSTNRDPVVSYDDRTVEAALLSLKSMGLVRFVHPSHGGRTIRYRHAADDRWHLPAQEVAVRQSLHEGMPVVSTSMRVPGGDAVQRVYAIHTGADELAIVEIENRSRLPFAVALAVRPYNPEGLAVVERIQQHDGVVTVDGRPALLLPKAPAAVASSTVTVGRSRTAVRGASSSRASRGRASASVNVPTAVRRSRRR